MSRMTAAPYLRALCAAAALVASSACDPAGGSTSAQRTHGSAPLREPAGVSHADAMTDRDTAAAHAAMEAMSHAGPSPMSAHMRMTSARAASPADSARGAELVTSIRRDLARYRDVATAQADGFRQFLPNVPQPVYHFTNRRWAFEEMFRFNPAKPTSLLYRKNADGGFTLVGVMYSAPRGASEEELDQRIPLGLASWHQHVNWCLPKIGDGARWPEQRDGAPVFGPQSPIATEAACDAVGGRFVPHLFGWMVHVDAFGSDEPARIWGGDEHGGHSHEMQGSERASR